jgi:N-carbamoyl-L-amino-acid hydrolase
MDKAERDLATYTKAVEDELGVTITARQTARTASVTFDERIVALVESKTKAAGFDAERILSGAGHDAQELAAICPTAMVFVPGLYDGISHNPRELSTKDSCANGVSILYEALVELAEEP